MPLRCLCRSSKRHSPQARGQKATYIILAPAKACIGLRYVVSVNIVEQQADPVDVEVKITGINSNKAKVETKLEGLTLGKPQVASLGTITAEFIGSKNILFIKGIRKTSGKVIFEGSHPLELRADSLIIFIQTDKAVYKPGDFVQFRVIVTKEDLTPFRGFINVQIKNEESIVIKQCKALSLDNGVATGELQLSDNPTFGNWSVIVEVENESRRLLPDTETKKFEVEKYVLPKFDVKISHPSYSIPGKDIYVIVRSKYMYGEGVHGKATVTISKENTAKVIEKGAKLDEAGTAEVVFEDTYLKKLYSISDTLKVRATVKEELTGLQRDATGEIVMHAADEKLIIAKQGDFFKPGMNYTFTVSVVTMDGKPITSKSNKTLPYCVTYMAKNKKTKKGTIRLGKDLTKDIVLKTPRNATELVFKVSCKGVLSSWFSAKGIDMEVKVDAAKSPSSSFIQIGSKCSTPAMVGDLVPFIIAKSGNFPLCSLTLQVISKGSVVYVAEVGSSTGMATIDVLITHDMAPKSRVVAYAIRADNGEVLVDAAMFRVKGVMRNDVTVSIDPEKTKPYNDNGVKNKVTVTVKADQESLVGLLGVDKSVSLLKSGNDITQSEVEKAVERYDVVPEGATLNEGFLYGVGGNYAKDVIANSGLLVFTDANVGEKPVVVDQPFPRDSSRFRPMSLEITTRYYTRSCGSREQRHSVSEPFEAITGRDILNDAMARLAGPDMKVRSEFPETWIWFNSFSRADGKFEYKAEVPDTISSFIVSAFAINPSTGLGIAPTPAQLDVFRPLFISLNLPYSIKNSEKFNLKPMIYNYGDRDETVTVTLEHNKDSGFCLIEEQKEKGMTGEIYNQRIVRVKAGGGAGRVTFTIVPTVIGYIKLLVKAVGQTITDGAEVNLLVEPEGVRVHFNRLLFLDFTRIDKGRFESVIDMMPPVEVQKDIVSDSGVVEFSVHGDLMGPTLSGLDNLIRLPVGSGEQNMVTMVPNIVAVKYLEAIGEAKNHPALLSKAKKHIEIGYQRELSYLRKDGSFSAFGERDYYGSTWLTAYVVRSFLDAMEYTFVNPEVLSGAISWLVKRENSSGEYEELGSTLCPGIQGGSGDPGVPMTAFVLIALIRANRKSKYAIQYLEDRLEDNKSRPYAIALTAYALGLANTTKFSQALDILTESAVNKGEERHWDAYNAEEYVRWWREGPEPLDIETTSYGLLSYLQADRLQDALACMRWLSARRNSLGGFTSTHDTVIGTWALSEYSRRVSKILDINVTVTQGNKTKNFKLCAKNRISVQREQLGALTEPVKITASGEGMALAQLSWYYNVRQICDSKPFECKTTVFVGSNGKVIRLLLRCRYILKGKSNMVLLEVEVPSGFKIDGRLLNGLYGKVRNLKKVKSSKNDTLASIYFDKLDDKYSCPRITMHQLSDVEDQKPSQIRLIDYYKPHNVLYMAYSTANAELTDMGDLETDGNEWSDLDYPTDDKIPPERQYCII